MSAAAAFEEVIPAAVPKIERKKRDLPEIKLDGRPVYITNALPHTQLSFGPIFLVPNGHALMTGRKLELSYMVKGPDGQPVQETTEVQMGDSAIRTLRRWKARGDITATGGTDLDGHEEAKRPAGSKQILSWGASQ